MPRPIVMGSYCQSCLPPAVKLETLRRHLSAELLEETPVGSGTVLRGGAMDSRRISPGMLFCAVRGARTDGNRFIEAAVQSGAAAVLSDMPECPVPAGIPVLHCRPGRGYVAAALAAEALAGFPAHSLRLLGITGTCGKTTTAFLLRDILRRAGRRVGMIGTVVYDDSVEQVAADRTTPTPFELQALFSRMRCNGVQEAVMEVSSAAIDQMRFGSALFDIAAFTNFSRDHLDYHGTMERYYECKRRLFTHCLKPSGVAVLNLDDPQVRELAGQLPGSVVFSLAAAPPPWTSPLAGRFNAYNVTCAGMMAQADAVPAEAIAAALASAQGAPGRLERWRLPSGAMAFVDYAHTPEEIKNALAALRPLCTGRLGIVFGCGGDRDCGKRPQMGDAASAADCIWLTSDNPRSESPDAIIADILPGIAAGLPCVVEVERRRAIMAASGAMCAEDFLLIAGKGHEDYQEINGIKYPFSDSAVLAEAGGIRV